METAVTLSASFAQTFGAMSPIDLTQTEGPGAPRAEPQPLQPLQPQGGDAAARYQEVQVLGRGGLGEVVEAFDQDLRRHVALKRPREERSGPHHRRALVEEAQITAQLDHPCIPAVHGLGIGADGRPYFSMALVTGQTLEALLQMRQVDAEVRAALGMSRLLHIFTQVCYAAAFAHARGVIHRDIKPENVMIGQFGEVRLMDWGVAKVLHRAEARAGEAIALEGAASALAATLAAQPHGVDLTTERPQTRAGTFIGTPGFAAPEQVEGRTDLDARADIYALGALLYVMLSGRLPVEGGSAVEWMFNTVEGKVTPLKHLVPVSDALAAITHKALARDPAQRYPSALALLRDLEAMQQGEPVSALKEDACAIVGRWYMSRPQGLARMRVLDFDLTMLSSFLFGVAAVAALSLWLSLPTLWLGVGALALAVAAGLWPLYTWVRKPRPDDPWHLLSPVALTSALSSRKPSLPRSMDETATASPL
jgi:serine/threonine protein kinase